MIEEGKAQRSAPERLEASTPDLQRAVDAFERGELEQAAALCQATLSADPVCLDALHLLCVTKSRLRQPADGLALFDRALALRPSHSGVCNNRGTALAELGRLPEALAAYDAAIATRQDFAEAHDNRGSVLMRMDRVADALASYGNALILAPDHAPYMNNMGRALTRLHRYDDALACFDDAIAQDPGFADAMLNRGRVLEHQGAFDDAVVVYGDALDAGVDTLEAILRRAGALRAARRFSEALSDYDRALRLAPGRDDILHDRSALLAERGPFDRSYAPPLRLSETAPAGTGRSRVASDATIDHITVITLDRAPDKFESFVARNAHLPIRRVAGIDGRTLDRWACVDEGLITSGNPYPPSSLGSGISHIRLWQQCAADGRAAHVAEDDATFRHDFLSTASALLETLSDWDIVLWGWNFDWPIEVVLGDGLGPAVIACNETALRAQWTSFPAARTVPTLLRLTANAGICAYSLSPVGATRLLQRCLPVGGKPGVYPGPRGTGVFNRTLDIEMTRHYASLKAFACVPCLAISLNVKGGSAH